MSSTRSLKICLDLPDTCSYWMMRRMKKIVNFSSTIENNHATSAKVGGIGNISEKWLCGPSIHRTPHLANSSLRFHSVQAVTVHACDATMKLVMQCSWVHVYHHMMKCVSVWHIFGAFCPTKIWKHNIPSTNNIMCWGNILIHQYKNRQTSLTNVRHAIKMKLHLRLVSDHSRWYPNWQNKELFLFSLAQWVFTAKSNSFNRTDWIKPFQNTLASGLGHAPKRWPISVQLPAQRGSEPSFPHIPLAYRRKRSGTTTSSIFWTLSFVFLSEIVEKKFPFIKALAFPKYWA